MDLGEHFPCLNVSNLEQSIDFYQKLDFTVIEDHTSERWAVLQHNNMALCLYEGHIKENMINFRGGDVEKISEELQKRGLTFSQPPSVEADGSWSAELHDPDGNSIYLNTFPDEREQYVRTGRLIAYNGRKPSP